jgi:hypothetical protein
MCLRSKHKGKKAAGRQGVNVAQDILFSIFRVHQGIWQCGKTDVQVIQVTDLCWLEVVPASAAPVLPGPSVKVCWKTGYSAQNKTATRKAAAGVPVKKPFLGAKSV